MMLTLILGNYNYSSWSLRAWLVAEASGLNFEVERYAMGSDAFKSNVYAANMAGLVPILRIEQNESISHIHDSLAIAEFLAEQKASLWPGDQLTRAHARAITSEMHSGFTALRSAMPMNLTGASRRIAIDDKVQKDINHIEGLWSHCLASSGGPWLFGAWTIADAFYAPVVQRLNTYQVGLSNTAKAYVETTLNDPKMQKWQTFADAELERIKHYDEIGIT